MLAGWCALLTGIVLYVANMACVYFMPRYALPLLTTTTIALLASMAGFCSQAEKNRRAESAKKGSITQAQERACRLPARN